MTRLLCTGDLHLGAGADLAADRLGEQEAVLERIVELANELEAGLVFAGDAWERRRPTPAEMLAFQRPLERLHRAGIVIPGNHDVEAFERPTGFDVLHTSRTWHLVSTPKVLGIGDVQYACLPWAPPGRLVALEGGGDRDAINRRLASGLLDIARGLFVEMDPKRPRVLVAHWLVGGSMTSSGFPVELARGPVIDGRELGAIGFDAVILGDIHRPQIIDADGLVFYVGSPMPLNFGEAWHDHVVWLLDVEAGREPQAFQIPIESRRLKSYDLRAETIGPEVGVTMPLDYDGATVKLRVHANEEQARRLDVAALRRSLLEPRKVASGHVLQASRVWAIQVEVERERAARVELDETMDEVDAFDRWLEASGLPFDTDRWGDLHDAHAAYVEELGSAAARTGAGAFNPLRLRASNFRTFRELDVELPAGVAAILGPNGAGKSSLIGLIDLALFGSEGRSWAPYLTQGGASTELEVELTFELGDGLYRVRRGYSARGSGKTTLDLEELLRHKTEPGIVSPEPLTLERQDATQALLERLLGLTRETFRASSMLVQGDGAAFTEAKPADRKRILSGVLGLERYDDLLALAKRDRKIIEAALIGIAARLERADEELAGRAALEETLASVARRGAALNELREHERARIDELQAEAERWRAQAVARGELAAKVEAAEAVHAPLSVRDQDAELAQRDLAILLDEQATLSTPAQTAELERREAELRDEIEAYRGRVMRAQETARTRETRIAERRALEGRAADLRSTIGTLDRRINALLESPAEERCDVCHQVLEAEARTATIGSLKARIQELEDEAMALDELAAGLELPDPVAMPEPPVEDPVVALRGVSAALRNAREAELHAVRLAERRARLEERIAARPTPDDLQKARQTLQDARSALEHVDAGVTPERVQELQRNLADAATAAKRAGADLSELVAERARAESTLERLDRIAAETQTDREERQRKLARADVLATLERAYGRNGIAALIIASAAIPSIETEAGRILSELGTSYRVELRTEKALASGDIGDTLDVVVVTEAGERAIETFSGGERTRLNIALRIGLARLLANRRGAESKLLAIDEPEFLDQAGTEALARVLHGLTSDFDRIYLISHVPGLRDAFDQALEVVRDGDYSEVRAA